MSDLFYVLFYSATDDFGPKKKQLGSKSPDKSKNILLLIYPKVMICKRL